MVIPQVCTLNKMSLEGTPTTWAMNWRTASRAAAASATGTFGNAVAQVHDGAPDAKAAWARAVKSAATRPSVASDPLASAGDPPAPPEPDPPAVPAWPDMPPAPADAPPAIPPLPWAPPAPPVPGTACPPPHDPTMIAKDISLADAARGVQRWPGLIRSF